MSLDDPDFKAPPIHHPFPGFTHLLCRFVLIVFWAAVPVIATNGVEITPRRVLQHHVPGAVKILAPTGSLPRSMPLDLSLGLPLRDQAGLAKRLEQLYDPSSPLYHQFLTPDQFAERFGPSVDEYQQLITFVQSNGFTVVGRHSNRLLLDVRGTVSVIEQVFGIQLKTFRHPTENRQFFAPTADPSIEKAVPLLDISGLDNFAVPGPMSLRRHALAQTNTPNAGSAPGGNFRGKDFRTAYAPGVAVTGTGQSIGLVEFDGYYATDIAAYETQAGLPSVPLQNILVNQANGSAGINNAEVALDIEVAISMAPGVASVLVYEGTSANTILSRMATDNRAKQLSSSWTFGINQTTENIFRQFATQGQTMFQASGDAGAYPGAVPAPADNPNVTVVGGTTLSTALSNGKWASETTWNWNLTGAGTNSTGGGISASYPIPSYQKGIDMSSNQGSSAMRNVPDVALTADDIWVVWDNGSQGAFGGTSAATPLWAGFMALVNQQAVANGRGTVGFLNTALYALAKGTNYASCFHDITTGNNFSAGSPTKFRAVPGYDLCTGWGTPSGQALINALAGGTNMPPVFNANPFTMPQVNAGQPCAGSISNRASDPNPAELLTFAKLGGPAWLKVAGNGALSGTPANVDVGTNSFVVSVRESAGMSNTATMFLNVNGAPSFGTNALFEPTANANQPYSISVAKKVSDANLGDSFIFSKVTGPAWLTVSSSGLLSGTPAASDAGTNPFTIKVTDSGGLFATTIVYFEVNGPPSFLSDPFTGPAVTVGQLYSATVATQAVDPNANTTLTFSKLSGPSWLSIGPDGSLSGVPSAQNLGTNSFTVKVADASGLNGTATMYVSVLPVSPLQIQTQIQSNLLYLTWSGGNPPFQVQSSTNLSAGPWQNVGAAFTNRSWTAVPTSTMAVFRVLGSP